MTIGAVAIAAPHHDGASAGQASGAAGSGAAASGSSTSSGSSGTAGANGAGASSGRAGDAGAPGTTSSVARPVTYHGHVFTVPAGWRLVDLAADPSACVRFDMHAVYFGTPSSDQSCGAGDDGRVQGAVLVEPSSSATSASATDDAVEQRITATLPGVHVTASYAPGDRSAVEAVLSGAGVPAPTAAAAPHSTGAVAARIAANLTPVQGTVTPATVASMTQTYTGLGFDACTAPSTDQMTAWGSSPFQAVGVYIGGAGRACTQPDLTASWVSAETAAGWHLLPLYVGPQIAYNTITDATTQGTSSADDAATQASSLGIGTGAVLYYDMEGGQYTAAQTATAQAFLEAWTTELHALHYSSGVYGSESGPLTALVPAWGTVTEPDVLDVDNWNSQADSDPGSDPSNHWNGHRVHQFLGPANATYGGVTINIDEDYFALGLSCGPTPSPGAAAQPQDRANCGVLPVPVVSPTSTGASTSASASASASAPASASATP